ncbi:MAG: FolM Alternative dihydrofolate reductase 1 [uncultured Thiotrichaceae bacterium]|uniref:FolM Alternative dihydrofolate reductase 1 n=1 Tax=uncultured Thiotrichaceae bacterium TaxID=298394 RepID=A0A6S6SC36_9GAMM|nr:MAG: FolM Alternative dihydrofolate reductase 1 [uncultured Thiotrichaceae bacterium]
MTDLNNRTVLITGAAKRIGAAVCRVLHESGANLIIHYRSSQDEANTLAASLNAIRPGSVFTIQADLCKTAEIPRLIERCLTFTGQIDVLINNASSFYPTLVGEITEKHWDDLLCSNVKAPLFLAQAATTELKKRKGCIINIVDIHGMRPLKKYPVYSSAKAALIMLTKSLAKELGPEIRVNGVAPGAILWPEDEMNQVSQDELIAKTALKREGNPDDIAAAIKYLIEDAEYTTGHIIPVDGGRTLNQ